MARWAWRSAKPVPSSVCRCLTELAHPLARLCEILVLSLPVLIKTEELCLCLDVYSLNKCYLKNNFLKFLLLFGKPCL